MQTTTKTRSSIGKALIRIQRDKREIQYVILTCIKSLTLQCPSAFAPFLSDFFVKAMDPSFTRQIKLDILIMLSLEPESITAVLQELRMYIRHHDKAFVQSSVRAVGKIAELAQIVHDRRGRKLQDVETERKKAIMVVLNCLNGLEAFFACSRNPKVLGECVLVMRQILVQLQSMAGDTREKSKLGKSATTLLDDPNQVQSVAMRRLFLLVLQALAPKEVKEKLDKDSLQSDSQQQHSDDDYIPLPPNSIAAAIWVVSELYLVSQYPIIITPELNNPKVREKARIEILRGLAKMFSDAEPVIQLQAIHLATKSILLTSDSSKSAEDQHLAQLCEYILELGKLDINPDVRDRARCESAVLRSVTNNACKLSSNSARSMMLHSILPNASHLPIGENADASFEEIEAFPFGTLSSLIGHRAGATFLPLPPWSETNTPSSLRDPSSQSTAAQVVPPNTNVSSKSAPKSFHDESSSEDSSSDSSTDYLTSSASDEESDSTEVSSSDDDTSDGESDGKEVEPKAIAATLKQSQRLDRAVNRASESAISEESNTSESEITDDSDAASTEDSEYSSKGNGGDKGGSVENLLALDSSTPKLDNATIESSISHGLEGLVMAPLVHDFSSFAHKQEDLERDSCAWKRLVRHELGGGLEVSYRYLRGLSSGKQAKLLSLTESAIIVQLKFENR
jgi:AP-3 complex subunit beta